MSAKTKSLPIQHFDCTKLEEQNIKKERPVRGFRTYYFTVPPEDETDAASNRNRAEKTPTLQHNPSVSEQNRRTTSIISEILDHPRPRAAIKAFYEPLQLLPKSKGQYEKNLMLAELTKEGPLNDFKLSKEPANLHTVCLPKKGLIKLTSMAYELNSPDYYDDRQKRDPPGVHWEHSKFHVKSGQCHGLKGSM
uniref:Uncharacterized protein n=1 Tax=Biomphalaria glabrata TaxID=6526 RepID=A0A2C9KGX8_BIOGL